MKTAFTDPRKRQETPISWTCATRGTGRPSASQIRDRRDKGPVLSDREHEILTLIADGLSAPEIGERLSLGTSTLKTHLQTLYPKLGVSDRAAAVAEAMRRDLLR